METGRARTEQEARATKVQDQLERQSCLADQDWVSSSTLDAQTAKPQTFRTGDGWFAYNLAVNLSQMG